MLTNTTRLRVRYSETDQMGVVYHANYIVWMEVGRTEFCREVGVVYRELEDKENLRLAVIEANCRFIAPARYDDEVEVRTTIAEANPRILRFTYDIRRLVDNVKLAEGYTKHIFLDTNMKLAKLPPAYFARFEIATKVSN
jgi:acyl-CoA thioester hydrolase